MSNRSVLFEVPEPFEGTVAPGTSYLRLGAVAQHLVADRARMQSCTPQLGATSAHQGAGEDLAALVYPNQDDEAGAAAFLDDRRDRCHPPELDGSDQQLPDEVTRASERLSEAEQRLEALKVVLQGVLDDPDAWLVGLQRQWEEAQARTAALEHAYQQALTKPAAPPANLDRRFCPHYTPKALRREVSQQLHTRGGWRDHTDGNRIITTRGDKLEVVRGNYRMVVLGRRAYPADALGNHVLPGWDVSGGHIDEETVTVAEDTFIEWKRRHNGTWYTLETIAKMDTQSVSTGDSDTTSFGHFQLTMTGSETPSDGWHAPEDCRDHHCHINPRINNESWATEMRSYTGSESLPVPEISDASWVETMRSLATSDHMTDHTHVRHSMTSSAKVAGTIADHTHADRFDTKTTTDTMLDMRTAGATTEIVIGDTADTTHGITTSVALATNANIMIGPQTDLMVAACANVNIGSTSDMFIGAKADLSLTGSVSVQIGAVIQNSTAATCELALVDTRTALLASIRGIVVSR